MNRTWWKAAIALLWLWPVAIGMRYWLLWDQLPARLATHFNAAGTPNGWMSRTGSLYFSLALMVFIVAIATVVLARIRKPQGAAWALMATFHIAAGVIYRIEDAVLGYSLGQRIHITGAVAVLMAAITLATGAFLMSQRGPRLPASPVIAEEVHAAPGLAWLFIVPLVIEAAVLAAVPNTTARVALAASSIALLGAAAMAWSGFHYVFMRAGLEVRTLGFRLRSIPAGQIQHYEAGAWSVVGGYGIRAVGDRRAYVWGNKGVRITTNQGEVFLGHSEPQRIIHDLDLVTSTAHS
jgi:Domain of unknown function (DUF1648)